MRGVLSTSECRKDVNIFHFESPYDVCLSSCEIPRVKSDDDIIQEEIVNFFSFIDLNFISLTGMFIRLKIIKSVGSNNKKQTIVISSRCHVINWYSKGDINSRQENKSFLLIQILYLYNTIEIIKHCNLHLDVTFMG